jgi:hypothetical protein
LALAVQSGQEEPSVPKERWEQSAPKVRQALRERWERQNCRDHNNRGWNRRWLFSWLSAQLQKKVTKKNNC